MKKQKITQFALAIMLMSFFSCNMGTNKEGKPDSNLVETTANLPQELPIDTCMLCNDTDDHRITREEFEKLLIAFDDTFVVTKKFTNNGGVMVLIDNSSSVNPLLPYSTFKLHMGVEKIGSSNRLLVTYEPRSAECVGGIYKGEIGIQKGDDFLSSYSVNDIVINKNGAKKLTTNHIKSHFFSNKKFPVKKDLIMKADSTDAQNLLQAFKKLDIKHTQYYCDDIMFNLDRTLKEINDVSKRSAFQYYFGLDTTKTFHKIRLILVGIDKNNQLVMYNGDNFLARESSRPRP